MSKIMHMDTQYAGITPEKDFSDLIDFFYPVGCYFETSDTSFDPNVSWSGYWVLETEGLVHISSGSNYAVSGAPTDTKDGGSKDAIIPYHNHTASGGSVSDNGGWWADGGGHSHTWNRSSRAVTTGSASNYSAAGSALNVGGNGSHSHWIAAHGHGFTQPTISYSGESTTDKNMPPYIIVNRWHRTA